MREGNHVVRIDDRLAAFSFAKLRFILQADTDIAMPAYKGSTLHGGFGHALQHVSPSYYNYFYHPSEKGAIPKAFVITPPLDTLTHYSKGDTFTTELLLIGQQAIQSFPICFAAFEALGRSLGFGINKGRFSIKRVESSDACGEDRVLFQNGEWSLAENAVDASQLTKNLNNETTKLTLSLLTRLRLKGDNRLIKEAPSFSQLLDRILGRISTLATFYQTQPLLSREERSDLLNQAESISLVNDGTRWDDWARFSGRQREWMKFGGLLGDLTYEGELTEFLPYLKLGEWLHVGGKTSFGLGKYNLSV